MLTEQTLNEKLASLVCEHVSLHGHRVSRETILNNIQWSNFKNKAIEHLDNIDWLAKDMKVNDRFYTGIFDVTLDCICTESIDHNIAERILAGCHQLIRHLQDCWEVAK